MATPQQPPESWYEPVIELMIHEQLPLLMAATRLGYVAPALTPEEASAHERRKSFRQLYQAALNRHYLDAAAVVSEKDLVLGRIATNVSRLEQMGKPKEAIDGLAQAAKMQGWNSPDTIVNNLLEGTPAEIAEARKRLEAELAKRDTIQ